MYHIDVVQEDEFTESVHVEIELIFVELFEMTLDVVEIFERHAVIFLPKIAIPSLNLIPHSLHLMDIELASWPISRERQHCLIALFNIIDPHLVPCRVAAEVPICGVEGPALIVRLGGHSQVTREFEDLSLENVEFNDGRCVLYALFDKEHRRWEVACEHAVHGAVVEQPEIDGRVLFLVVSSVELARRLHILLPGLEHLADLDYLLLVFVKLTHIEEKWRDTLDHHRLAVGSQFSVEGIIG